MTEPQETIHFLDYWRILLSRKEIVIAVSLLVILTGILITLAMPRVYMASAVIAVKEESPDVAVFSREMMRYDPLFLRTQFEIIQSDPVLEEVVRVRDLDRKLSKAYGYSDQSQEKVFERTVKLVSKWMKVQQYRDTNLIEIQMYLAEPKGAAPQEAALAANMIASVYRDQSMRRSRDATESALKALHEALDVQKKRVSEQEQTVEEIRQKYELDVVGETVGTVSSLDKLTLTQLEAQRITVRLELAEKEARYKTVESLSPANLLVVAPYVVKDPILIDLVSRKRLSEVSLSQLEQTHGSRHPDVERMKAVISEQTKKIQDAVTGLKAGVKADFESVQQKLDIIRTELESMKTSERKAQAEEYREFEKALEELNHARRIRDALEMRYLQEKIELRIPRTTVELIEPAKSPDDGDYVSPDFMLNFILSIMVGLASGIGLAFFIEYLDTSVKTIEDVESFMRIPVLGVIPQRVQPLIEEGADVAHAEAYRVLRTNIQFSSNLKDGKTMCVTSGSVGEGKSLTLFNLAYVCAQLGDRVLLVDSDLHRPRQHKILGVSKTRGLANVLVGDEKLEDVVLQTEVSNLKFLPSGSLSTGVHGLLDTQIMKDLVKELREVYDLVLFDSPPMIGVSDASLLVREMDGVLLVIQHRKYSRALSNRAKEMITNVGGNLVGVVLNNINISRDYSYYYEHYYSYPKHYGYGYGTADKA